MINSVIGTGRYMMVSGGTAHTYINSSSGYMNVGNVRFNTNAQTLEVYDGTNWVAMNTARASVGLTLEAELAIDWAVRKQREDMELEALSKSNPTIADLVEQKKNLDHKIKMVQILIKEEPKIGTN